MPGKVQTIDDGPNVTITLNGSNATVTAGGNGEHGILVLRDSSAKLFPRVVLNSDIGELFIGKELGPAEEGAYPVFRILGASGNVSIGGNDQNGELALFPAGFHGGSPELHKNRATIHLRATDGIVRTGGAGVDGRVLVLANDDSARITLDAKTGDIILANSDCAEDFDVAEPGETEPGTVMVLDDHGCLRQSRAAYDKRVAGVISGAGTFRPGIILDRTAPVRGRVPLALVGKVFCKVDAQHGEIQVGDLLTTSPTPGHAMKATDPARAFGAVLGKALRRLPGGQALLPVLVALQ
jgi:hypothetical protein